MQLDLWRTMSMAEFLGRIQPELNTEAWVLVIRRDPCSYCYANGNTIEHVIPKKDGGRTNSSNLVGACGYCNNARGSAPLHQFLLWLSIPVARRCTFRAWLGGHRTPAPYRPLTVSLGEQLRKALDASVQQK